jgi:hypothetical protein
VRIAGPFCPSPPIDLAALGIVSLNGATKLV